MRNLLGVHLDFDKMAQNEWELHFRSGELIQNNQLITLDPAMIEINPELFLELTQYKVYYNYPLGYYIANPHQSQACKHDQYLGAFMVQGCTMKYFYPDCYDNMSYTRSFTEAFNTGYIPETESYECGEICQPFNNDFSLDYQFSCELLHTRCQNSLGGPSGRAFNLDGYIKIPCPTAKE